MTMISARPGVGEPALPPGLRPVTTGARIGARLLDGVLGSIAVLGGAWAAQEVVLLGAISVVGIIGAMVFATWVALGLWALLRRGARLGGLLLGQRWIRSADGGRPGLAVLGKFVVQHVIGLVTLGIGEPIISLVTLSPPHHRTWFDRLTGLVLVTGLPQASRPPTARRDDDRTGNVHQVGLPEHRVPMATGAASTQPATPSRRLHGGEGHAGRGNGSAPAADWSGTPGNPPPITAVGVRQVNAEFIESTPWSGEEVARPVSHPAPLRRPAVIRPRRDATAKRPPGPAPHTSDPLTPDPKTPGSETPGSKTPGPGATTQDDHTVFAPFGESGRTPWLRVDDGTRVDLGTAVVFGREPTPPPDLAAATPRSLTDPTMRLSKTHLAIGIHPDGVWVLDLFSTNGVRVNHPDKRVAALPPGQPTPIPVGSRVEFGGRALEVRDD